MLDGEQWSQLLLSFVEEARDLASFWELGAEQMIAISAARRLFLETFFWPPTGGAAV